MSMATQAIESPLLLVDGELRSAPGHLTVTNPSTGETLTDVPAASTALLEEAVAAAHRSAPSWGRDLPARQSALALMAQRVAANRELLAKSLMLELGLTAKVAEGEVAAAASFLKYRATTAPRIDTLADDARQHVRVVRSPVGVVAAIVPWNAPLMMACEKAGTALAAGNTVILKPSPLAPLTVLMLGALLKDTLPPGVLNILNGDDTLGPAMVEHPMVNMISFTGSTATGRKIMAAASPRVKRLSLELGGNDAAIVRADVDVARTAERIFWAAFFRSGQICVGVKRLYVHRSIMDRMVAALAQIAAATRVGDPGEPNATLGPISNRQQFDRITALAAGVVTEGGSFVCGGHAIERPGFFFAPGIVTGLAANARLVTEEQFGPLLPVLPFDDDEEAIAAANATDYGLGNSVWTDDTEAGYRIAERLESGSVWMNRHGVVLPDVPFGGMKQSGLGRANGDVGLDNYCELRTLSAALPRKA